MARVLGRWVGLARSYPSWWNKIGGPQVLLKIGPLRESLGHSHFGGPKNCSTHFNHMLISHHNTGYTADTCDPRAESERLCRELGPNTSTGHQICRRLDQWLPTLLLIAQGRIIWRDRFIVLNHVLHWYYMILHLEPRDASRAKLLVGQRCWSTPARKSWPHPQPISRYLQGTGSVGTELLGCPMMEGHPRNSKIWGVNSYKHLH
jgi:hypothetical protein